MVRMLSAGVLVLVVVVGASAAEEKKPYLGVQLKADEVSGALVVQVVQDASPAAKAGMKTGDIILKLGDKDAGGLQEFVQAIRDKKPGDKIEIKLKRDDKEMTLKITLGELPSALDK
jgi:S1-C subfamily serine protease